MKTIRPDSSLFNFKHLPSGEAREVSKRLHDLYYELMVYLPNNNEKDMAIRKLLEAKDCAVRSVILGSHE